LSRCFGQLLRLLVAISKATIIVVLATVSSNASAMVGETLGVFERGYPTSHYDYVEGGETRTYASWQGNRITHNGIFVKQGRGRVAIWEEFMYSDQSPITEADLNGLLSAYFFIAWRKEPYANEAGQYISRGYAISDNQLLLVSEYGIIGQSHSLRIWIAGEYAYQKEKQSNPIARAPTTVPAEAKADCMVVATETYARLAPTSAWAAIVGVSGKPVGHAMAAWKVTATGHVMIYVSNSTGTVELPTSSQSIEDIGNAFTALEPYCVAANGWHEWRFIKVK
jgi:hypothetical protein